MNKKRRRPLATISMFGVSFLHRQNPYMVAWWSAAFPGYGQYLANQYLRATLMTLSEKIINTLAHINEAMVYTFCGEFASAKSVLQPRWVLGYLALYLYAIWDSYRSALVQNKLCHIAELEDERLSPMLLHPLEIQYLEPKSPYTAALYSFFYPGLGQLYNHRFGLGFYAMFFWTLYMTLSRSHESIVMLIIGDIKESIAILHPHWLLFMPSVLGGAVYHAFITAVEHNRLFRIEQRQFFTKRYRGSGIKIFSQAGG
ncbi:MAG: hypothetical protein HPY50_09625 [Firmicutes bacterium]|nr:hypothetical protein [Bacillota bacterium]